MLIEGVRSIIHGHANVRLNELKVSQSQSKLLLDLEIISLAKFKPGMLMKEVRCIFQGQCQSKSAQSSPFPFLLPQFCKCLATPLYNGCIIWLNFSCISQLPFILSVGTILQTAQIFKANVRVNQLKVAVFPFCCHNFVIVWPPHCTIVAFNSILVASFNSPHPFCCHNFVNSSSSRPMFKVIVRVNQPEVALFPFCCHNFEIVWGWRAHYLIQV